MKTIKLFRMEHFGCDSPGHGPYVCPSNCNYPTPDYGQNCGMPGLIRNWQQCAVSLEQRYRWWPYWVKYNTEELLQFASQGWRFTRYEVPEEECREDGMQFVISARPEYVTGYLSIVRAYREDKSRRRKHEDSY